MFLLRIGLGSHLKNGMGGECILRPKINYYQITRLSPRLTEGKKYTLPRCLTYMNIDLTIDNTRENTEMKPH